MKCRAGEERGEGRRRAGGGQEEGRRKKVKKE